MKRIAVIDTKLVMYYFHHRKLSPLLSFEDVAKKLFSYVGNVSKVVWVRDAGSSKRTEFYPDYKKHRADNIAKMKSSEQKRLQNFISFYTDSYEFNRYFGDVIGVTGYEADDLASYIAKKFAGNSEYEIILVSSDEDWARFLYADNVKMLHFTREVVIGADDVEKQFGVPYDKLLCVSALAGVSKENVKGIKSCGKNRVLKAIDEADGDCEATIGILQEWVDTKKYGAALPDGVESVEELYERNLKIFTPIHPDEDEYDYKSFKAQWGNKKIATIDEIVDDSLVMFNEILSISPEMQLIFKINT